LDISYFHCATPTGGQRVPVSPRPLSPLPLVPLCLAAFGEAVLEE